jgi:chromosomal replication initiator protein
MERNEIWNSFLKAVEEKVGQGVFELWFKPIRIKTIKDDHIILEVPNRFYREWLEENYTDMITETLSEIIGHPVDVKFRIAEKQEEETKRKYIQYSQKKRALRQKGVYINPKYTFEQFVVGPNNQFAHAAAVKVAESPGTVYNPLFVYGGVGLGKTHLISAIGNMVLENNSDIKVIYVQSEHFTNEVVSAIRNDRMAELKEKYRNVDLLLIDDIQFIAGKTSTQEEFFHTFNALYEQQKQIVISSDRPPKEIKDITDRLKSRFSMGLIADIQPPDVETKMAIIYKKAENLNLKVPEDVAYLLASKVKSNIRDLEGCLLKLAAMSSLTSQKITLEMAKNALKDIISLDDKPITVQGIIDEVARFFDLRPNELRSRQRTKELANARKVAMYIARHLTDLSLGDIGKNFGGKNHATVIYACKEVEKRLQEDSSFATMIEQLIEKIKSGGGL